MESRIKLSRRSLAVFKRLYQVENGETLSDEEAQDFAYRLLHIGKILARYLRREARRAPLARSYGTRN
jgi:hypothetical protein